MTDPFDAPSFTDVSTVRADDPKAAARRLRTGLAERGIDVPHGVALDLVARSGGHRDWNTLSALTSSTPALAPLPAVVPILRSFDQARAYEFYCDFLGFEVVWEHRFEPGLPLYVELARAGARLHLSEHHGDASPGGAAIIEIGDAFGLQRELRARAYPNARPGVTRQPWGFGVDLADPFHNQLRFLERAAPDEDPYAPLVAEARVRLAPERTFELLTARLGDWWPSGIQMVDEASADQWWPGHGWRQSLDVGPKGMPSTTVRIDVAAAGGSSIVCLRHGGWNAQNVSARDQFTRWEAALRHFGALAARS